MQRFERHLRRPLHPDQQRYTRFNIQLPGKRRADQQLAFGRTGHVWNAMEPPEPIVDTVDTDVPGATAGLLCGDDPWKDGERRGWMPEVLRELGAEESSRDDRHIGGAKTLQYQIAEAAADGVADEQRAGEHRHRGRHTGDHGEVRPPVIAQSAGDELSPAHRGYGALTATAAAPAGMGTSAAATASAATTAESA